MLAHILFTYSAVRVIIDNEIYIDAVVVVLAAAALEASIQTTVVNLFMQRIRLTLLRLLFVQTV